MVEIVFLFFIQLINQFFVVVLHTRLKWSPVFVIIVPTEVDVLSTAFTLNPVNAPIGRTIYRNGLMPYAIELAAFGIAISI